MFDLAPTRLPHQIAIVTLHFYRVESMSLLLQTDEPVTESRFCRRVAT